jgi:uncharacterized membrane protein HdeD (DUF308 family)
MVDALTRNWWMVALRGFLAVILAFILIALPIVAQVAVLVIFFGAYMLVDGGFTMAVALMDKEKRPHRWLWFVEGLLGVMVGIMALAWPAITAFVLLLFIGAWAFATGVVELIFATQHWKKLPGHWLLLVCGIVSVLLGILILVKPMAGTAAVLAFIEAYLLVFGAALIWLAFGLKGKKPAAA